MAKIKKSDFVELDYTGKVKENNIVFDTTDRKVAEENGLNNQNTEFNPIIICVGEKQVLPGIDSFLEGKEPGKYELDLAPEEGFGKKDAKLIQMIPANKFKGQNINPMPGLQVNIDGLVGMIKTVTGGRVIIDFNPPLSGKELHYELDIKRIVADDKEKIAALLEFKLNIKDAEVTVEKGNAKITSDKDIPEQIRNKLIDEIKRLTEVNSVSIEKPQEKGQEIKRKEDNQSQESQKKGEKLDKP